MLYLFTLISLLSGCIIQPTTTEVPSVTLAPTLIEEEQVTTTPMLVGIKIHEIQGRFHRSILEGKTVENVYGIVTAKKGDGFYIQDPEPDDDLATSEGIFVKARGFIQVKVGDGVLIKTSSVKEFNPAGIGENSLTITQLENADFEVISQGNSLPEPIIIGKEGRLPPDKIIDDDINGFAGRNGTFDPETDGIDFFESMESMLIQINNAVAVSPTSSYKEIAIVPDGGSIGGIFSPRGTLILQKDDPNPERILLDDAFVMIPAVKVGDKFIGPQVGIMDYSFGSYKLELIKKPVLSAENLAHEVLTENILKDQISVATYNVENLNALENPQHLKTLANHIVHNLKSPDILGLQEVQDNDGEVDSLLVAADQSFEKIIQAIKSEGGPDYKYLNIDPIRNADGGVPGGNIRVGILFRTDRGLEFTGGTPGDSEKAIEILNVNGFADFSINPGRISPLSHAFQDSRKPLAAIFEFKGQKLYVIVNHLNSKGGDGALYGDVQPPTLISENQRIEQARILNNFVKSILMTNMESMVIVLGDLNDFTWSEPIQILAGKELTNLIETLPINEQYSYIYEGNAQVLDHILVSNALVERTTFVDIVHVNSEYFYQDRLSDHDPVIAIFDFIE